MSARKGFLFTQYVLSIFHPKYVRLKSSHFPLYSRLPMSSLINLTSNESKQRIPPTCLYTLKLKCLRKKFVSLINTIYSSNVTKVC